MKGIYLIRSPIGAVYIGQSVDIERRFNTYRHSRAKNQRFLELSFRKYGTDNHSFDVYLAVEDSCDEATLDAHEIRIISEFKERGVALLNITNGGSGSVGLRLSEEAKAKLRAKAIGRTHSEATRAKLSKALKGKRFTDEHKHRLSLALRGRPVVGHKHTEESKLKIANALRGRPLSNEHRQHLSITHKGPRPWRVGVRLTSKKRLNNGQRDLFPDLSKFDVFKQ